MKFTDDYLKKHLARKNMILASHKGESEVDAWHTRRLCGLGGSDIGAVMGINKYLSPVELWEIKTMQATKEKEENKYTHWGHILEETVAQEFARVTGMRVNKSARHFCSKELPFLVGNIDRFVSKNNNGRWLRHAILECKTATEYSKGKFNEDAAWYSDGKFNEQNASGITGILDIPASYYLQCLHYMYITGVHTCYLAVLIGGSDYRIYVVPYNVTDVSAMLQYATNFWCNCVLDGNRPNLTQKDLYLPKYETAKVRVASSDDAVLGKIAEYKKLKEVKKLTEEQLEELEGSIIEYVGENSEVVDHFQNHLVSFKTGGKTGPNKAKMKALNPRLVKEYKALEDKCKEFIPFSKRTLKVY